MAWLPAEMVEGALLGSMLAMALVARPGALHGSLLIGLGICVLALAQMLTTNTSARIPSACSNSLTSLLCTRRQPAALQTWALIFQAPPSLSSAFCQIRQNRPASLQPARRQADPVTMMTKSNFWKLNIAAHATQQFLKVFDAAQRCR